MFKIAIVDDEEEWRNLMTDYVKKYSEQNKVEMVAVTFKDGIDLLMNYRPVYDIIFFDIDMLHSNGMDIAHKIREIDEAVTIIFVTNLAQYAIQGYEVSALDFIVKPLNYFDFAFKMDKAVSAAGRRKKTEIIFRVGGQMRKIDVTSILYLESRGHCILIHGVTEDSEIWHQALKEVESRLASYNFARCNNCYLVNLQYVKGVKGDCVCVGNEELPISRGKRKTFLAAVSEYLGNK